MSVLKVKHPYSYQSTYGYASYGFFSDYLVDVWLTALPVPTWIGLGYDTDPGSSMELSELAGTGYERKPTGWLPLSRGRMNDAALLWDEVPAIAQLGAIMGFDAQYGGNLLFVATPPEYAYVQGSTSLHLDAQQLIVGLDMVVQPPLVDLSVVEIEGIPVVEEPDEPARSHGKGYRW